MATSAQLRREILAGQWDEALCTLYGTEPAVLARQRQRYAAALEQFELYYGSGRQVHVYSAPGRAELGGNHTDHQHGYGLAAAVTLDLVAVASPSDDGFIRVKSRGFNKLDVIDLSEAEPQQGESTHSASLIRGIAEGFRAQGKTAGGFDAYTASDVLRGSGLSSSAAFEMGMAAILNGEYGCGLTAPELAKICQYAENTYFGKPSGLLDEFAAIRHEMESVAACLGGKVLGQVKEQEFWKALPRLRKACGDRAVLRAVHYFEENARALAQRNALVSGDFNAFLQLIQESGHASFALCQNVYCSTDVRHQGLSVALALSQTLLEGQGGAWRMQGGGFAGTIQAFVPGMLTAKYHDAIEKVFGAGSCYLLRLREQGALRVI